jgi:hypothetical protein
MLGLVCLLATGLAQGQINSIKPKVHIVQTPDWIVPQDVDLLNVKGLRAPSHYYLIDSQVKTTESQQAYTRYVFSLTDPSAIASQSNIRIRFSPAYQTLNIHEIKVIRDNRNIYTLKSKDIQVINVENQQKQNIYSGDVEALILLDNIREGDVVDYSFTIKGKNPILGDKFSWFASLASNIAVDLIHVNVDMPIDRVLQFEIKGVEAEIIKDSTSDRRRYQISQFNTPAVVEEDSLPDWYDPYPSIQFSEYESWEQVSNWANDLFDVKGDFSEDLQQFITELKALEVDEAINKAIHFSQDKVRYLGLEFGLNSHKPHAPNDVFDKRYGDCKDKTLLLVTLLKQIGVKAYPALVSSTSKGHVSDYLPTHAVFDHVIVQIEYKNKVYWIDPTITHQSDYLESKFQPNYGEALLLNHQAGGITLFKDRVGSESEISITENLIAPDYFSAVQWKIKTVAKGNKADNLRYRIKVHGKQKLVNQYLNYYAKVYPDIEQLDGMIFEDDKVNNVITLFESYLLPEFWALNKNNQAEFTLFADNSNQYVVLPHMIKRKQPLYVYGPISSKHKVTLQLPEHVNFNVEDLSSKHEDEYIYFSSTLSYDNRKLTVENIYRSKNDTVHVSDVPQHISLLKKISNKMSYSNGISNVTQDPGYKSMKNLMTTLKTYQSAKIIKQGL